VAKSFLAAHLPDGVDARTTVSAQVTTPLGPKRFSVSGSVVKAPGWRAVYGAEADEDTDSVPGKAKPEGEPTIERKQRWSATDEAEELLILRGDHATVLCACMAAI
jgi:DNA topoisomerase-3